MNSTADEETLIKKEDHDSTTNTKKTHSSPI
jgi:hypothetical protein